MTAGIYVLQCGDPYATARAKLTPTYTPFGAVSSGLNIVRNVAYAGYRCEYPSYAGGGVPKEKVVINSVTITIYD